MAIVQFENQKIAFLFSLSDLCGLYVKIPVKRRVHRVLRGDQNLICGLSFLKNPCKI